MWPSPRRFWPSSCSLCQSGDAGSSRGGTPKAERCIGGRGGSESAKRKKVRAYPELVGPNSRAQWVVLAVEVGGRWSSASVSESIGQGSSARGSAVDEEGGLSRRAGCVGAP